LILDRARVFAELINLERADLDLESAVIPLRGKGRKERRVPISNKGSACLVRSTDSTITIWCFPLAMEVRLGKAAICDLIVDKLSKNPNPDSGDVPEATEKQYPVQGRPQGPGTAPPVD
jgi:hypothetical protein